MNDTLNHFGTQFLSFAWPMLWQSSLLIAVVFAADLLLERKLRASVRHALWLVVLVKLLLPPTLALPTSAAWWLFPAKPVIVSTALPIPKSSHLNTSVVVYDDVPPPDFVQAPARPVELVEVPPPELDETGWTFVAAGTVSLGLFFWLLLRWIQLTWKVREAGAENCGRRSSSPQTLHLRAGAVPGAPALRVRIIDAQMSPAVFGLFRPLILLPRALAERLSPTQLRAVLLHEAIHIRRCDIWVNCAQSLLQILYWWHPLVWLANARMRRVREEAVDDAVMLAMGNEADTYAPTLLEVAKLAFRRPLLSLGILGLIGIIESRSALRQRVERLLDFRPPRKAGLSFISFCAIFLFSAVALPMGQGPAPTVKASVPESTPAVAQRTSAPEIVLSNAPSILLSAEIYQIPPQELNKLVSNLTFHDAETNGNAWWSASTNEFSALQTNLANSGFQPVLRPRIQTFSDRPAQFYVGNYMHGTELDCLPVVHEDRIDIKVHGEITSLETNLERHQFTIKTSIGNHGGIVIPVPDDPSNSAVFMKIEVVPAPYSISDAKPSHVKHIKSGHTENSLEMFPPRPIVLSNQFPDSANSPDNATANNISAKAATVIFLLNKPKPQAELQQLLTDAGVQMPPTSFIYNEASGALAVAGSADQLQLVNRMVLQLNGYPPSQLDIANQNFAAILATNLVTRTFRVDPSSMTEAFKNVSIRTAQATSAITPSAKARSLFSQMGVDLLHPPGKSVFYNNRLGVLFVKATASDLDTIEHMLQAINEVPPQLAETNTLSHGETTSLQTLVQDGKVFYEMGKFDEARVKLNAALAIDPSNATAKYYLDLVNSSSSHSPAAAVLNTSGDETKPVLSRFFTSKGRQDIIAKLDKIRLDNVSYNSVPLSEVLRRLSGECRLHDPERKGINFLINNTAGTMPALMIDPLTGQPIGSGNESNMNVGSFLINLPSLDHVRLADVLDAIVLVSDHPLKYSIQDFAIVFSAREPEVPQLFTRIFRVTPEMIHNAWEHGHYQVTGNTNVVIIPTVDTVFLQFFASQGIDFLKPPGKSVYFADKTGRLSVKATAADLLIIERALSVLAGEEYRFVTESSLSSLPDGSPAFPFPPSVPVGAPARGPGVFPAYLTEEQRETEQHLMSETVQNPINSVAQVHIKARFIAVPKGTMPGLDQYLNTTNSKDGKPMGILSDKEARAALQLLQSQPASDTLAEPEITVLSGRQTQMRATETISIITNMVFSDQGRSLVSQTNSVEVGPTLDAVPIALADGNTINLTAIPSITEFLGYNFTNNQSGHSYQPGDPPPAPVFQNPHLVATANVWDNQTLLLTGLESRTRTVLPVSFGRPIDADQTKDKDIVIFITATLVDRAGSRIHSDTDLIALPPMPPQPQ